MKVGDLVIVQNTSTGDSAHMIDLWRSKVPKLVVGMKEPITGGKGRSLIEDFPGHPPHNAVVLLSGEHPQFGWINKRRLKVISSCK